MNKLVTFFLFMLVGCGFLVGIMGGGGGVVNTYLTTNVTANMTYLPVASTTDFLQEDYVMIEAEKVFYEDTNSTAFLNCTRGYENTTAAWHGTGTRVNTAVASAINYALGFNIIAVQDELGWAAIIAIPIMFFARTIPHIFHMSTNLLTGNLAIISWMFYIMAAGFIVTLALSLIGSRRVM